MGHGTPGDLKTTLFIDVQFNFPATFRRDQGGAFLRQVESGKIVLAHRGIVTLGKGRFPKDRLFDAMAASVCEAATSKGTKEFLLIAELDSKTLIEEISAFSSQLRTVLRDYKADSASAAAVGGNTPLSRQDASAFGKLGDYFDEFSGKRRAYKARKVQADCHHGLVVAALEQALRDNAHTQKSREIDLVALRSDTTLLVEVKTSADPQSVYTAIGQLSVHAPRVAQIFSQKTVAKVVVLPEQPMAQLGEILGKHLGIKVILYTRTNKINFTFSGLDKL